MLFSQTELMILEQLAKGNSRIRDIAKALRKSDKQIYRAAKRLSEKNILTRSKGLLEPRKTTHTTFLLHLLVDHPNLAQLLSGSGMKILTALLKSKTIEEITQETGLKKSCAYNKLGQALNISLVKKEDKRYVINEKLWPNLKEFLVEFKKYHETIDLRVPINSIIYYKTDKEIVFSNKAEQDAALTAFSAYGQHGIKLLLPTHYYYLPKKRLSRKEVFLHSLHVAEKEKTIRHLTYISLFYIKFKKELSRVKHPILEMIKNILRGKDIPGYPTLREIKEKADTYDIRV